MTALSARFPHVCASRSALQTDCQPAKWLGLDGQPAYLYQFAQASSDIFRCESDLLGEFIKGRVDRFALGDQLQNVALDDARVDGVRFV
jgi:hypothetical protein